MARTSMIVLSLLLAGCSLIMEDVPNLGDRPDGHWNVDPAQNQGSYSTSLPAVGLRGGRWNGGSQAGAFALHLADGPASSYHTYGAPCCRTRRSPRPWCSPRPRGARTAFRDLPTASSSCDPWCGLI